MAQVFKGFPIPSADSGGGGGTSVIGGGPYAGITGFGKGSDSATFLDVKGYPVTNGATVKAIQLSNWNQSAITSYIGVNSAGATVWTSDTTSLSTTTSATITQCSRPVWDGTSSDMIVLCAPAARTPIYLVSVNLETGNETLIGNVVPTNAPNAAIFAYTPSAIDYDGANIYWTNVNNTQIDSYIIDVATPSILHEYDHGDLQGSTASDGVGAFKKIAWMQNVGNVTIMNMETGGVAQVANPTNGASLFAPCNRGQGWGAEYVGRLSDIGGASATESIARVQRWPRTSVSGFFKSLGQTFGIDGGVL